MTSGPGLAIPHVCTCHCLWASVFNTSASLTRGPFPSATLGVRLSMLQDRKVIPFVAPSQQLARPAGSAPVLARIPRRLQPIEPCTIKPRLPAHSLTHQAVTRCSYGKNSPATEREIRESTTTAIIPLHCRSKSKWLPQVFDKPWGFGWCGFEAWGSRGDRLIARWSSASAAHHG